MSAETLQVGGVAVDIPRAEKPLFPDGITRAEVAAYYWFVGARMLPHVHDRPLAMEVSQAGEAQPGVGAVPAVHRQQVGRQCLHLAGVAQPAGGDPAYPGEAT